MLVLITYDVKTETKEGRSRLRKIAKICVNYGLRVQNSVFECNIENALWVKVKDELLKTYDKAEDSLRFYYLGNNYRTKLEHFGAKPSFDVMGFVEF